MTRIRPNRTLFLSITLAVLLLIPALVAAWPPSSLVFPPYAHTLGIRKGTKTHLLAFLGLRTKFTNPQGLAAIRLKSWDDPSTSEDDDELCIIGVNSGEGNLIYNPNMVSLATWGSEGSGKDRFRNPRGIAGNDNGDVYIADVGNNRIVRLLIPKSQLNWVGEITSAGGKNLSGPRGVALDAQGNLYITDSGNNRVLVFAGSAGNPFLREFGSGELTGPDGIAVVDKSMNDQANLEDFLVVIDQEGNHLSKYSLDGKRLATVDLDKTIGHPGKMEFAALDFFNSVWVTDSRNCQVHKFDHNLNYLVSQGRKGEGDYEFESPRGIALYRHYGQVFIAEEASAQYYWIGVDCTNFIALAMTTSDDVFLDGFLTDIANVTFEIYDASGKLVHTLPVGRNHEPGKFSFKWNRHDDKNQPLPSGTYRIKMIAAPTYSSRKHFQKEMETTVRF